MSSPYSSASELAAEVEGLAVSIDHMAWDIHDIYPEAETALRKAHEALSEALSELRIAAEGEEDDDDELEEDD